MGEMQVSGVEESEQQRVGLTVAAETKRKREG